MTYAPPERFGARVTDPIAFVVESTGCEITVTLLVQGTPVSGLLTATQRHYDDFGRVYAAYELTGGGDMDNSTEPPTEAEVRAIRAAWADTHPNWKGEAHTFRQVCLRDATVRAGMPQDWCHFRYLLIDADHIGALGLGLAAIPGS